jgi:hypothetical protein
VRSPDANCRCAIVLERPPLTYGRVRYSLCA